MKFLIDKIGEELRAYLEILISDRQRVPVGEAAF